MIVHDPEVKRMLDKHYLRHGCSHWAATMGELMKFIWRKRQRPWARYGRARP